MTTTTTTTATTLAAAYALAAEALAEAEARAEAAQSADYPGSVDGDAAIDAAIDAATAAVDAAEAVRDAARDAYRESDEPRLWSTSDGGGTVDIECQPSELEDVVATDWSDCWDDDGERGTWWCHVSCHCEATGETEHVRVEIAPVEPDCDDEHEDHDWRQRGVVGHGGGVVVTEVCRHCGQRRITDTWAQDAHDGSQGHTAISYESPDEPEDD